MASRDEHQSINSIKNSNLQSPHRNSERIKLNEEIKNNNNDNFNYSKAKFINIIERGKGAFAQVYEVP